MARIIKYYAENGVTVIEEGLDSVIIRPSFSYNDVSDIVTIINLDNQAQDWSAESSVFRKKDGSSIGSTKDEIVTYLSENTVFSKGVSVPDPSWGSIVGTLSDQTDLQSALDSKQDELVSGTNIKTVNNTSILGSGNIETASVNPTSGILPVNDNGVFVDSVVSENSNKIGIGTTSPSTELHVVGAITVNDGNNNTKVGTNSGLNFTGINQSAFGYNAGLSSSGDNQTVVGYQAGQSNTATSQSAFGRDSGRNNTGINQSAFGRESGSNNSGENQSVLGSLAGFSNTGDNQTAVGREAGRSNTGDNNSNFGYQSGYYLSNGSTVNTGSSDSVFLGSNTKASGANQTNQIVIGYNATGIGANSVVLGNDSIATTALKGNVGIGTTSPNRELEIEGDIQLSDESGVNTRGLYGPTGHMISSDSVNFDTLVGGNAIRINPVFGVMNLRAGSDEFLQHNINENATIFSTNGSERMRLDNSGNLGIGTTAPSTELHVVGAITVNDGNNNTKVGTEAGLNYSGTNQSAFGFSAGYLNTGANQSAFGRTAGRTNTGANQSAFGVDSGRSNAGGNQSAFGVSAGQDNTGDNQSAFGLAAGLNNEGASQSAFGYYAGQGNTGVNQSAFGFYTGRNNTGANQSTFGINAGQGNTGAAQSSFGNNAGRDNTGDSQSAFGYLSGYLNTGANQSAFGVNAGRNNAGDNNSNFGYQAGYFLSDGTTVNTASSASVFIGSSTKALGVGQTNQIVIGYGATGIGANSVVLGNDNIVKTALKGNVGIGTTSPSQLLNVVGSNTGFVEIEETSFGSGLLLGAAGGASFISTTGAFGDLRINSTSTIRLSTDGGSTTSLFVNSSDNVGIGTASPSEKLDVSGTVRALGYKSSDGSAGVTQNVNTGGGNTLVIKNGIITQVI